METKVDVVVKLLDTFPKKGKLHGFKFHGLQAACDWINFFEIQECLEYGLLKGDTTFIERDNRVCFRLFSIFINGDLMQGQDLKGIFNLVKKREAALSKVYNEQQSKKEQRDRRQKNYEKSIGKSS